MSQFDDSGVSDLFGGQGIFSNGGVDAFSTDDIGSIISADTSSVGTSASSVFDSIDTGITTDISSADSQWNSFLKDDSFFNANYNPGVQSPSGSSVSGGNNGGYSEQQPSAGAGAQAASQGAKQTGVGNANQNSGFGNFISGLGSFAGQAGQTGLGYIQAQNAAQNAKALTQILLVGGVVIVAIVLLTRKKG